MDDKVIMVAVLSAELTDTQGETHADHGTQTGGAPTVGWSRAFEQGWELAFGKQEKDGLL